jgi:hypothetical protein
MSPTSWIYGANILLRGWLMQFCLHAEKPQGNGLLLFTTQIYIFIITKTYIYT